MKSSRRSTEWSDGGWLEINSSVIVCVCVCSPSCHSQAVRLQQLRDWSDWFITWLVPKATRAQTLSRGTITMLDVSKSASSSSHLARTVRHSRLVRQQWWKNENKKHALVLWSASATHPGLGQEFSFVFSDFSCYSNTVWNTHFMRRFEILSRAFFSLL